MIRIAGRLVQKGDRLYHRGFALWGNVTELDDNSVRVEIVGVGQGNTRTLLVTDGGLVSGMRQMYWHEPLALDLPKADVSQYQFMIEATRQLLGDQ